MRKQYSQLNIHVAAACYSKVFFVTAMSHYSIPIQLSSLSPHKSALGSHKKTPHPFPQSLRSARLGPQQYRVEGVREEVIREGQGDEGAEREGQGEEGAEREGARGGGDKEREGDRGGAGGGVGGGNDPRGGATIIIANP